MTNDKNVIDRLKNRVKANTQEKEKAQNYLDVDQQLLNDAINYINEQSAIIRQYQAANDKVETLSTTQFFNPSLAQDMYNMNGNALPVNSYLAIRKMLGIINNNTPGVLQPSGFTAQIPNNDGTSTGVGLSSNKQVQGWWLWTMILNRINYFNNLFKIECKDIKLKKAIHDYITCLVLSGYGCIEKINDRYIAYALTNIERNEYGDITKAQKYNPGFVMNELRSDSPENLGLSDFKMNENTVCGTWRTNGYNIWYYVMSYLMNSVDLLYIFWNRGRLNKTIIEQIKGNNSTASKEALNYINPYQNIVTINSVSVLDDVGGNKFQGENRYNIRDLGSGEQTQLSFNNFLNFTNWWDSEIGIRSAAGGVGDGTRSITDEVQPDKLKLNKQQYDMLFNLELFAQEIKEKFNVEVSFELEDIEMVKENPETKDEGGSEAEQDKENKPHD